MESSGSRKCRSSLFPVIPLEVIVKARANIQDPLGKFAWHCIHICIFILTTHPGTVLQSSFLFFRGGNKWCVQSHLSSKMAELVFELKTVWVLNCHAMLPAYTRDLNRWQVTHKTNSKCRHPWGDVSQGIDLALRPHLSFPLAMIKISIRHPFSS